jgi:polysaccharide export outer membrane protein
VPTAAPIVDSGYVLGAGDRVRIDIFDLKEYGSEGTSVLSDGTLNLPLVGTVAVQGMSVQQATDTLTQRYAKFIKRPIVTLSVLAPRPLKVAVSGEVIRPGAYIVTGEDRTVSITGAIKLADGVKPSADLTRVQIRRTQALGGQPQILTVNLLQLIDSSGDASQDQLLRDGDTVVIPPVTTFDLAQATKIAKSSLISQTGNPITVLVTGEVFRPGPYALSSTLQGTVSGGQGTTGQSGAGGAGRGNLPTLASAIQAAGGIKDMADIQKIEVTRKTSAGDLKTTINFIDLLKTGDTNQDIPLQEGDTITIPTAVALTPEEMKARSEFTIAPATISVNVVGEVKTPGTIQVPPSTPLNEAINRAGGFSDRAARGSVQLIRVNPNGTAAQQKIAVDFAKGIDDKQNPPLRNNDTVVVNKNALGAVSTGLNLVTSPFFGVFNFLRIFGVGF